ncbi:hypothetical protein PXK56_17800 [Phaeobacter gallaeciensis]|uniref:hypothetical protein n=1 Tax=Phaeobacter gallaeciensis TaxID=60890 RepID=UPI00237FFA00|nr:hypothetical protein [Phaeobacter gallaeciensis]MDE4297043.1 hypothetical protein [Phaeobacter gallaeciensis]
MPKLKTVPSAKRLNHIPGTLLTQKIDGVNCFSCAIPIGEFLDESVFKRNTHQRDEEMRNLKHLQILQPEHLMVHVLQGYDGRLVLVDGHSRRFTWQQNGLIRPSHIELRVYDIADPGVDFEKQELRLYESHDSRRAVKTSAHTVQGALNALDIELKTKWLRIGRFSEAMKKAAAFVDGAPSFEDEGIGPLINFFHDALVEFDNIMPSQQKFCAPFISAALIMLHSKTKIVETRAMLRKYSDDERGHSVGHLLSSFAHLAKYRDEGLDGTGCLGAVKGKFGTSWDDMNKAVPQILSLMVKCRDHENEKYAIGDKDIKPMSRREILVL